MDALKVYQVVLFICVCGLIVSTLEYLAIGRSFSSVGVYSWKIIQLRFNAPHGRYIKSAFDVLFNEKGVKVLLILRLLSLLLVLAVPIDGAWFSLVISLLVVNNLAFNWRRLLGDDGSDQMSSIILITLALCVGTRGSEFILNVGLWFIALQACLSYNAAGIAKLISPQWRSGEAIYRIFNTGTYGLKWVARFLENHRGMCVLLCWSVIIMETLFPLCLVLPEPWNWTFFIWGALFHLQCAVIMGLNSFLWAFIATYPAIIYVSSR